MPRTAPPSPAPQPHGSRALFGRLWRGYLSAHRGTMALAFVFMLIDGSTLAILAWLLGPLFDRVFVGGEVRTMWSVGGLILGLFVIRGLTVVVSRSLMARVAQRISTAMQVDLLAHLLTLDGRFFQDTPPGALIERVQGDTLAVQGIWSVLITGVGRDIVALVALFSVAVAVDPVWTLIALIGAPLLIVPVMAAQRHIRRKIDQVRTQAALRATRLDEVFHGITAVQLNRIERYQIARFRGITDRIVRAEVRAATSRAAIPGLIDVVTGIGFFSVLMLGGHEIIAGNRSVGEFMSFFTAMALAFQPLRRLGDAVGSWQVAAASLTRLYRLFDTPAGIVAPARPIRPDPSRSDIRFEDVQFAYGDHPVLNGLSFSAEAGQTTAIVGASGAGKSTVFRLLTRLADPASGRVTLGGQDLRDLDLDALRDLFSTVSQEAALFDETIRDNVLLGRGDVPEAALRAALGAAHVSDFTDLLALGIDTPAGPRGSALSGGQRQRVAIARALVRDAPILLLDEATSALDAAAEALVQEALDRLGQGRTTLVIAHRLATVRRADRIIVLDRGRVAEQGTHETLLAQDGLYAGLCRLQFAD